jgi:hypothetical protein
MPLDNSSDCGIPDFRLSLSARIRVWLTSCRLWLCMRISVSVWQLLVPLIVVGFVVGLLMGQLAAYQGQQREVIVVPCRLPGLVAG